jgi:hypothetical protein
MIRNSSVVKYLPRKLIDSFSITVSSTYHEDITEKLNEVANITEKSTEAVNITEKATAGNNKNIRLHTRALRMRHNGSKKLKLAFLQCILV